MMRDAENYNEADKLIICNKNVIIQKGCDVRNHILFFEKLDMLSKTECIRASKDRIN